MSMTSRQRVMTAFDHQEPDRVPIWCGPSPEFWDKCKAELNLDDEGLRERFHDDFRRVLGTYAGPDFPLKHPEATGRTVFGVERRGMGYGQPLGHPLSEATIKDVNDWPWPDPTWVDVSHIRREAEAYDGQYAIMSGSWSPFWHDAIDLLGMENLYMKMYDDPELVDALFGHLVDYYFGVSQRMFEEASDVIDIFFMGNDLGSQNGPLMSPQMFERFLQPHFAKLIDLGHQFGLKTQLHCCGGIFELIPHLIEAGLDALHSIQPTCRGMDLQKMKSEFGDRMVFNGGIDSHHILIEGDVQTVVDGTKEVLDIMMPGGGYVGGASHDTILEQTPVENALAMFDTILEYGVYR